MIKKIDNMFYIGETPDSAYAYITFEIDGNILSITHTVVDKAYSGQGIGKRLVKEVVDYAIINKYQVYPICSFALKEFNENNEYQKIMIK